MFKGIISKLAFLITLVLLSAAVSASAAGVMMKEGISAVFFNGSAWYIKNGEWTLGKHVAATNENNVLFVSLEDFSEALNCKYEYNYSDCSIYIKGATSEIWQALNSTAMFVNRTPYENPAPYIAPGGAVMIPLEPYSSVFGVSGIWETPNDYLPGKMTLILPNTPYIISRISVNEAMQMLTIYGTDPFGNVQPLKYCICSTGADGQDTATPTGTFKANPLSYGASYDPWYFFKDSDCWVLYCTQVSGNVCFHSVPVNKYDMNTLSQTGYQNLGKKASHGCIRLLIEDAEFIWRNCRGVTVDIIPGQYDDTLAGIKASIQSSKPSYNDYKSWQKQLYPQTGVIK